MIKLWNLDTGEHEQLTNRILRMSFHPLDEVLERNLLPKP